MGECFICAIHLINRMPFQVHHFISSYEKLFQDSLHLDHLRVLGYLCFISTIQHKRTKFDYRAAQHVFLGYSPGQKGYKLLYLKTLQISVSRYVIFFEQHFPFHISKPTSQHLHHSFFLSEVTENTPYVDILLPNIFTHI